MIYINRVYDQNTFNLSPEGTEPKSGNFVVVREAWEDAQGKVELGIIVDSYFYQEELKA